jgi:predicted 3-demethylubiquinone-9 3-methyltransferase (glyoxalase superfamily)
MQIAGQEIMFIDAPSPHEFDFTPSFSFFIECADETELDEAFAALSTSGKVMMPPDNYGFSKKFTWIEDRWGVSWQLNYNGN